MNTATKVSFGAGLCILACYFAYEISTEPEVVRESGYGYSESDSDVILERSVESHESGQPSMEDLSKYGSGIGFQAGGPEQGARESKEESPMWYSEEALYEIEEFRRDRGYYLRFEKSDYHSYPIETLEELADSGDYKALHVLGLRYQEKGKRGEALSTYAKAAVYGSTSALGSMSTSYQSIYHSVGEDGDQDLRRSALIGALAHSKVAADRGDSIAKISADSFIEVANIDLTDKDIREIDSMAEKIYERLLKERQSLGLGEFDDDIPSKLEAYDNSAISWAD